ncbi:MAG: acetyl-CoA carboxylase carboxyl transferase subunit beta [Treponema sp.]|nr:acetyl-CoA carboxylase carboxyl transferase subunit beta [Treponema sp.]
MTEKDFCPGCNIPYNEKEVINALYTCPECGLHYKIHPQKRIDYLADSGSFTEISGDLNSLNPAGFSGYEEKLSIAKDKTNMNEAIITGTCTIEGKPVILGIMTFDFMGGSMGSVVGEKVSRVFLKGAMEKKPVIIYTTSGGARMQEGIISLFQMAKTASAAAALSKEGIPYFVVLCDPTTGGVTASFAMLANIIMAEPDALIGFAGPRVIEGTIKQKLPKGFQRAEFQMEKGFVDIIVPRKDQKKVISALIDLHRRKT